MYLVLHCTIAPAATNAVLDACREAFDGVAFVEVVGGFFIAKPTGQRQKAELLMRLLSVERAFDPELSLVLIEVPDGQWWLVSDPVADAGRAAAIAGRVPVSTD